MANDPEWQKICSDSDMYAIQNNNFAFGIQAYDVNIAIDAINGIITDKQQLHDIAVLTTTPPAQPCQAQDWKDNWMAPITKETQGLLNKWLAYK